MHIEKDELIKFRNQHKNVHFTNSKIKTKIFNKVNQLCAK